MTDRRIAAGVVVLGGVLTGAACFLDVLGHRFVGEGRTFTQVVSLWELRTDAPGYPVFDIAADPGWPVVAAAAVMVVAALGTLAGAKVAGVARLATLAGAGALAGVLLLFVVETLHQLQVANAFEASSDYRYAQTVLSGFYLLVAGTLTGLAGAVLAQRPHAAEPVADDATPPFGIALPVERRGD
ncbi:hypothetical protein ACVDFE_16100 [Lentzea chajnantorensis]